MLRKLLIVLLCGFVQHSTCSRMRFEQGFAEPIYRHEPHIKREHFYPRGLAPNEQIVPQQGIIREPVYGNEPMMPQGQQQGMVPQEEFIPNEQMIQGEPIIRGEPFIRREPLIRREPILRREGFIRGEPMIRGERIYQNPPAGIFRSDPGYTVMVSPCPCQEAQNMGQPAPQDTFFSIPQQPIMAHRLILPKAAIKPPMYQPIMAFPRVQRFYRKSFKPIPDNIQFASAPIQNAPECTACNACNGEPVSFPQNFQNQGQQQENTSEPSQSPPVTMRTMPQMSNPLALAQMSSIC